MGIQEPIVHGGPHMNPSMPSTPSQRRKRGARFQEIAQEAGVSVATVDRVLNERDSVSPVSREKVLAAARRLGINRFLPESGHRLVRIDVLLPANDTPFFRQLRHALELQIQMLDRRIVVHRTVLDQSDEALIAQRILRNAPPRNGLIVTAPDTPRIRAALDQAMERGETVVTMATDVACSRPHAYVGIDHLQAGRTAGLLLRRLCQAGGDVLVIRGRSDYSSHQARQAGCIEALAGSDLQTRSSLDTWDEADRCYFAVVEALREQQARGRPLVGIYNTGGGSEGIAAALHRAGLAGKVAFISHEANTEHQRLLQAGVMDFVIDQDAPAHALAALRHVLQGQGLLQPGIAATEPQSRLYCAANLPSP